MTGILNQDKILLVSMFIVNRSSSNPAFRMANAANSMDGTGIAAFSELN